MQDRRFTGTGKQEATQTAVDAAFQMLAEEATTRFEHTLDDAIYMAEAFRETLAAVHAASTVSGPEHLSLSNAVQTAVVALERLALQETPSLTKDGSVSALYLRAAQVDSTGQLPELHTELAAATVRGAIRRSLLEICL